jgi:trimeric autotransporter adhesin
MILGPTGDLAVRVGINTSTPRYTFEVDDAGFNVAGIYGVSNVVGDAAIFGNSTATSGTGSNGGQFQSVSPNGSGVATFNDAGGYALYAEAGNGGYAGYFLGNVTVTGTLTKGGGSFKIDDPIDPAGKYLSHSFVESPDMMNIYNGNAVTDAKGYVTVTMPDWFEALNRDFRYQLTTINSFSRATVAAELKDGKFRIRTSQPHVKVSWQVTGIRHDAWANANRIPNEEAKPANEQGRYLHPELYGAGPDKSVVAMPAPVSTPTLAEHSTASTQANAPGRD